MLTGASTHVISFKKIHISGKLIYSKNNLCTLTAVKLR